MRSLLVVGLILVGLMPIAFGMTYEEYLKSLDNDDIDSMVGSLQKYNESTSIAPGLTFVLKNDMGKPQQIETDFMGNLTLKADEKITHIFPKEGIFHYWFPNGKNKFTIEVTHPDWYYKVDNQTKQTITDDLIEKKRLQKEIETIDEQLKENGKKQNDIVRRAAAVGGWTDELRAEAQALSEEFNTLSDTPQNNRVEISNIEKNIIRLTDIQPITVDVEPPTKLEQIRNSTGTPDWVKTLFTWHDQKLISTKELAIMVKYLIENEIIT